MASESMWLKLLVLDFIVAFVIHEFYNILALVVEVESLLNW